MSDIERIREALSGDPAPLARFGIMVTLEDCRWPRFLCRLTRHRFGRLRHQREILRKFEAAA